ncbi:single-stranded DNA-binding protein [Pseudoflavonifractor sp. MSJ-37]|uniref:single-stranded DNA-binding protein n=1 Tax=Pseudoflavonifractor sp. MSJ-37 TaxID=2841531 RepID=UPI001C11FDA0|nr:single-stranded DNA-binding protein [Pseudoflavonifractor sp. MSJ-37]MBU5435493.1 single-stranded DNA-binding protein [Pseudoflavonifractor sp. MSJ-37]
METNWNENQAVLRGTVLLDPVLSHENHGVWYEAFPLNVRRLSGTEDRVNVIASQSLLAQHPVQAGQEVEIEGEVRSFNNKSGRGSRLVITLYAKSIRPAEGEHGNELILAGALCKPPVYRRTPMGREICDLLLAVNRRYGRADYLPCIAWGALARRCADLEVGDAVRLAGRFQSRTYTKVENGESTQRTAYEISIMQMDQLA